MSVRLYDTATRQVHDFVPLEADKVGIYLCGLTVQSSPHVGYVRSGVNFDVLRRWLTARGYDVHFIRNITDIASYWVHNAWITTAGEKMSKSLGTSLSIPR